MRREAVMVGIFLRLAPDGPSHEHRSGLPRSHRPAEADLLGRREP